MRYRIARPFARPHLLEVIELAHLGPEYVDDDVGDVDDHPVAVCLTLDAGLAVALFLELALDLLGDRAHVPVGPARGDHHVIAERRLLPDVDRHHVLGFGIVEPGQNMGEQSFRAVSGHKLGRRRALTSTLKCAWHLVLGILLSSNPWRDGQSLVGRYA